MADRPTSFGFTAESYHKQESKYDLELEQEARIWMESVIEQPLGSGWTSIEAFHSFSKRCFPLLSAKNRNQSHNKSKN